jgi:hypothetical protein
MRSFFNKPLSNLSPRQIVYSAVILPLFAILVVIIGTVIGDLSIPDDAREEADTLNGYDYSIIVENKSAIEVFTAFQLPKSINSNEKKYEEKNIYHVRVFDVPDGMSKQYKDKCPEDVALTTLDDTEQKQILHILTNDKDKAINYLLKVFKK